MSIHALKLKMIMSYTGGWEVDDNNFKYEFEVILATVSSWRANPLIYSVWAPIY
jgi:hypothetical protein